MAAHLPGLDGDTAPATSSAGPPGQADLETRHAVYSALLAACPLSEQHRAGLMGEARQLSAEALGEYGTLPERDQQGPLVAGLVRRFGADLLLSVPGFVEDQTRAGGLRLGGTGLLIPVRDAEGRIQALQVRQDRGAQRDAWLSTVDGPSSGTPAHVARPPQVTDRRVWLTEGPLNAAIAARQLGAVVLGIAGHATWRAALPTLATLLAAGHDVTVIALASDDPARPGVVASIEGSRQGLAAALASLGYAVRLARWPHAEGKGLDALLLAGHRPAIEVFRPRLGSPAAAAETERSSEKDDDWPVGLTGGTLTDGKKLRILANVLLNKDMKPTDKVTLCDVYLLTGAWPTPQSVEPASGEQEDQWRRKPIATIAARVNAGRSTVSRTLDHLQARGLTAVQLRRELPPAPVPLPTATAAAPEGPPPRKPTPRTVAYFRPARPLGFEEVLPEAEHRVLDRARRCPGCGSDRLVARTLVCTRCGMVATVPEAERAAAAYERARHDAPQGSSTDQTGGDVALAAGGDTAGGAPALLSSAPRGGCVDSARACGERSAPVAACKAQHDADGGTDGARQLLPAQCSPLVIASPSEPDARAAASESVWTRDGRADSVPPPTLAPGERQTDASAAAGRPGAPGPLTPLVAAPWCPADAADRPPHLSQEAWDALGYQKALIRSLARDLAACPTHATLDERWQRYRGDNRFFCLGEDGQRIMEALYVAHRGGEASADGLPVPGADP